MMGSHRKLSPDRFDFGELHALRSAGVSGGFCSFGARRRTARNGGELCFRIGRVLQRAGRDCAAFRHQLGCAMIDLRGLISSRLFVVAFDFVALQEPM